MIKYIITPEPNSHIYHVSISFIPNTQETHLKLPTWIPGSYMLREFSKNIIKIDAKQNAQLVHCEQINKNTWELSGYTSGEVLEVTYDVYALDFGIRTAYLDCKRGYFNNTSLCLYIVGHEQREHSIQFNQLPKTWNVATGLKLHDGKYVATNYDELIDCPFEIGEFTELQFMVLNTIHYIVLSGSITTNFDSKKLIEDVTKICETQINLFGGIAPFDSYTFMLYLGGEIYTGLEHRNSTALMAPYYSLPVKQQDKIGEDYLKLLGLISHEYFHLWNVKRIKPQVFNPYDLENENYTKLLWWFEGITSYYDDLVLYRAGLIDQKRYLKIILDNINSVYKFSGVNNQSLTNSSLTAWIKYYRQDENSPNSLVSYYVKGALVGLCLDLTIRQNKQKSLDDVLQGLYNKWQNDGVGIEDTQLPELIKKFTDCDLAKDLHDFINTTNQLPLTTLLKDYGINLEQTKASFSESGKLLEKDDKLPEDIKVNLGIKVSKEQVGYRVINIYDNSIAQSSGLAANDLLLAIDNLKINDLDKQLSLYKDGDKASLTLFRQEQLINIPLVIKECVTKVYFMKIVDTEKLALWL